MQSIFASYHEKHSTLTIPARARRSWALVVMGEGEAVERALATTGACVDTRLRID
jgi:hypothetical protein